jgi:chromosome segregation ATPase
VVPPSSAGALDTLRSYAAAESERLTLRQSAAALAGRCAEAEGEAARCRDREIEHERWIASLRAAQATAETETASLRAAQAAAETELAGLRAAQAAAETEIAGLRAAQAAAETEIASLRAAQATAETEIASLRQRDADISRWNETLTARLAEARSVLGETAHYAEQSRLQAGELDGLVAAILSSRSLRLGRLLTAPARWGRRVLLAESRHESLRAAAASLEAARRPLAEETRRIVQDDAPEAKPQAGDG